MGLNDMPRKMAQRVFQLRADRIKDQIRDLPLAEKFRVVADFIDSGQAPWALAAARHALSELEKETPDGGEEHG